MRGLSRSHTMPSVEDDYYTAQEAAKILRVTERTIRRRAQSGELEGSQDPITGRWKVSTRSVHEVMPDRPPRRSQEPPEASEEAAELRARVEDLQRQLGRLEGQRELEEVTQSTLREQLDRERERADRLDEELRETRRPWWKRVFGA